MHDALYLLQGIHAHNASIANDAQLDIPLASLGSMPPPYTRVVPASSPIAFDKSFPNNRALRQRMRAIAEMGLLVRYLERMHRDSSFLSHSMTHQSLRVAIEHELASYALFVTELPTESMRAIECAVAASGRKMPLQILCILGRCQHPETILSYIYDYSLSGSPCVRNYALNLSRTVLRPFLVLLWRWLHHGDLSHDKAHEFFVQVDTSSELDLDSRSCLDLWYRTYVLDLSTLPSFIDRPLAHSIYQTGVTTQILNRFSDHDSPSSALRPAPPMEPRPDEETLLFAAHADVHRLSSHISSLFKASQKHLVHVLIEKYHLVHHLYAIRQFLLVGRQDFCMAFIDKLGPMLDVPISQYASRISIPLDNALSSIIDESDYALPFRIRDHLDVHIRTSSSSEIGWNLLYLSYSVHEPLSLVLDKKSMDLYAKIFRVFWRNHRIEHTIHSTYERLKAVHAILESPLWDSFDTPRSICNDAFVLLAYMSHVMRCFKLFYQFDIIQPAWSAFSSFIFSQDRDIDLIIAAHKAYLSQILDFVFFRESAFPSLPTDPSSASPVPSVARMIFALYSSFLHTCTFIDRFASRVPQWYLSFLQAREQSNAHSSSSPSKHHDEHSNSTSPNASFPDDNALAECAEIHDLSTQFASRFREGLCYLISTLNASSDQRIKHLALDLDYSGFFVESLKRSHASEAV